jgi:hypothetical protein
LSGSALSPHLLNVAGLGYKLVIDAKTPFFARQKAFRSLQTSLESAAAER